jgi:carboxymethylenebutenolidase
LLASCLAVLCLAIPAFGQYGGLKQKIQNQLNQAEEDRNRQVGQETGQPQAPNTVHDYATSSGMTEYRSPDGVKARMYIAHPFFGQATTPKFPALLIVHEWWGLNEDICARADEMAAKGYYTVAVDLYDGQVTKDPKQAAEFKKKLTDTAATLRMKTALNFLYTLGERKIIDPKREAVIGWCMGGEQAVKLAVNDPRVKATVVFYGTPVTEVAKLKMLKGPVLGIFGNEDASIPTASVDKFESALKEAGIDAQIERYPNAGHAFASPSSPTAYKPELAKDANEKMYAWLDKNVKGANPK